MKSRLLPLFAVLLSALLPLAALAAAPAGPPPVEGADYVVIEGGRPYAPARGKVEVVEVFGYTCPHCAHFEPLISAWKARQPASVNVVALAAPFGGYWNPYAKAYFAAQHHGVLARSHGAMFAALHEQRSLPIQNASTEQIAAFYAAYGIPAKRFAATMESPATAAALERARNFITASGVEGTPTLIVNGKYRVIGKGPEDALRIADHLVARERAAR